MSTAYEVLHVTGISSTPYPPPPPPHSPASPPPPLGGGVFLDPFSNWLLSMVGWELPMSEDQQALVVSLLGAYVLFTAVVAVLIMLVGVGNACDDIFALLRGECCLCWARFRGSSKGTWVLLDEETDVMAAAVAAAGGGDTIVSRGTARRGDDDEFAYSMITHRAYDERHSARSGGTARSGRSRGSSG